RLGGESASKPLRRQFFAQRDHPEHSAAGTGGLFQLHGNRCVARRRAGSDSGRAGKPQCRAGQEPRGFGDHRRRSSGAHRAVTRAAELPSLNLSGNGARTYTSPTTFAGPSYSVSLGLSIPIFNGFSHQYDVAAARAQADATSAFADLTRQNVVTQVFVSYYALQTAQQRVATADDLLASAEQSAQVAAGRYREGVGSIIDLLTAQSALASARAQQVQARWQWYTSLAQLARDAGVLGVRGETPFP